MNRAIIPAHLFVGPVEQTKQIVVTQLKAQFCLQTGCTSCGSCTSIATQQHHAITWISPQNFYTRDDLVPLFRQLTLAAASNEKHFFILENAHLLTPTCANSLLKSLEEPPAGYFFMLLALNEHAVLPTIRSRCLIRHSLSFAAPLALHPLISLLSTQSLPDPLAFSNILDKHTPLEHECATLVEQLLMYWNGQKNVRARTIIARLTSMLAQPPMPGSSKLFWKNIYLQLQHILS